MALDIIDAQPRIAGNPYVFSAGKGDGPFKLQPTQAGAGHQSRYCAEARIDEVDARSYLAASTDRCTAASMEKWIEQSPEQPFFALMWTNEDALSVHGTLCAWRNPITADLLQGSKARYLLGIREADAILQDFVDFLDRRNLLRSTLIVVVGDHGEGFRQHGAYAHGTEIYDEFVRIPFLLINPVLFDGKVSHRNAALIDLAPTTLGLLGERSPSSCKALISWGAVPGDTFILLLHGATLRSAYVHTREANLRCG